MSQSDSSQNRRWDKWMYYWTGSGNDPQRTKHIGKIDRWYSVWFLYCVSIVSLMSQSNSSQNRRWDKWMYNWTGSGNHPQRTKHLGNIDRWYSVWFLYCVSVVSLMSQSDSSQNRRWDKWMYKQWVLMHRHQGWNVRHGLCHIYMRYLYIYELFIAFVCFVVCSLLQRDGIFGVLCCKWQARESTGMFGNLMAIYYIMPQFIQNHSRFVMLMKTCMIS